MPNLPMSPAEPEIESRQPFGLRDLLLAAALVAALLMLSMLIDLLHQNIERGNRIRAAQRANSSTLVSWNAAAGEAVKAHQTDFRAGATVATR